MAIFVEAYFGSGGAGLLVQARLREPFSLPTSHTCRPILFFGGFDLVESRIGADWKPWWLFVGKVVVTEGIVRYYRPTREPLAPQPDKP